MAKIHVTTTINGEPMEFLCEPQQTHARRAARTAGSHRHQGRLRLGRLRRLQRHGRRPLVCSCLMLAAEAEGHEIRPSRAWPRRQAASAAAEIPRDGGAAMRHLHAGLAGRLRGAAARRIPTRPRRKSASGSPATSAAAPAMTRSSARCWKPPPKCASRELEQPNEHRHRQQVDRPAHHPSRRRRQGHGPRRISPPTSPCPA